jgi:hypothetical protein
LNFGSIFICEALGNSNQMNIHDAALYWVHTKDGFLKRGS